MSIDSNKSKNRNTSYFQVIPSDLNFMVFSNLTVPFGHQFMFGSYDPNIN